MRTVNARKAWFFIRTNKDSYPPAVQALIKICGEIIDYSPTALWQKTCVLFENIIICMAKAIEKNDVTYEFLLLFREVIQNLDKFQADWCKRFHENVRGNQIAK